MRLPHVKTLTLAIGAATSLAAVTAFGVAPLTASQLPPLEATVEAVALEPTVLEQAAGFVQQEKIRRGDTLASLLARLGADDADFAAFVRRDPVARRLLELKPGRTVSAVVGDDRTIERLSYRLSADDPDSLGRRLVIARDGVRFVAVDEAVPIERSVETRSAEIRRTLVDALDAADIPDNVVTKMADVFGTDVDLQKDVRRGDRLRVVYETIREAGSLEPPIVGKILAVQFRGGQRKLEAVWFDRGDGSGGYYTFDGRNLSRPFLASPLEFTRVSSGFTENRLHPVLRDWRAHKGVDMPAPIGTNVRAVANGTVDYVGLQRGYGNVVVVKHDNRHTTLYAHLDQFAGGLQSGTRVRQGEVIGTVGQTGWATGPHLHFEFHIDGQHVDPMAVVAQEPVRALQGEERARFASLSGQYRARFGLLDTQLTARFE
ncbi:MAG: M23 family metallopeptidase [Burkholderiales bacterium]|jgi:murein DD-endopeptidase MepM/ murein hydrolase activator NlpD